MKVQRTSVGLDVHARSVVTCGLDGDTGEVVQRRLTPDHGEMRFPRDRGGISYKPSVLMSGILMVGR